MHTNRLDYSLDTVHTGSKAKMFVKNSANVATNLKLATLVFLILVCIKTVKFWNDGIMPS